MARDSTTSDIAKTDSNFVGTPDYLAPEQATVGGHVDERSDIYSLGCTLYYLLAGEPPFREAASTQAKLLSHTTKAPTELTVLRPDLASDAVADIDAVLKKMMAKSLDNRYQSVDEVIHALSACGSDSKNGIATDSRPENRTSSHCETDSFSDSKRQSYVAWPLVALATIGCVVMLATVLTLKLSKGTLIVEASPQVEVSVLGDKVKVIDTKTERKFLLSIGESRLKPGEYRIIAEDIGQGYSFSSEEFSIVRGEETRISVRLKKITHAMRVNAIVTDGPESLAHKTDSEVAAWLFGKGAKRLRVIGNDERVIWIHNRLEIPGGCQIHAIDVSGLKSFGDAELKPIAQLKHLSHLELTDTSVTDVGMSVIASIRKIDHIDVSMITSLTDIGFRSLASLPALRSLRYVRANVSAEEIKAIAELSTLSVLALNVRDLPDSALQPLSQLTELQILTLENSTVDGSFTKYLIGCKKLRHLDICSGRLDAEKVRTVGEITSLDHLNISYSGVDGKFLSNFEGLTNLQTVIFVESEIDDDDAEFFRTLPKLKFLELRLSEISDAFVARLGIIPSLRTLNLADSKLTDASVVHLAKMSQLQTLDVRRTQLTKSGITELVRSLPHCHINYDQR